MLLKFRFYVNALGAQFRKINDDREPLFSRLYIHLIVSYLFNFRIAEIIEITFLIYYSFSSQSEDEESYVLFNFNTLTHLIEHKTQKQEFN